MTHSTDQQAPSASTPFRVGVGDFMLAVLVGVLVAAVMPLGAAAAAALQVTLFPGDSIQAAVDIYPEGTTFLIQAGVHRRQQVIPKNDDIFLGEPGAVLTGEDVAPYAFTGSAVRVTIRGLVIEHYNPPLSEAPIASTSAGFWVVENNEVRHNSHIGIEAGPHWVIRNNYIHHNGQLGMSGAGDGILVESNEIAFNNTAAFDSHWEAGGTKFVYTTNLVVRDNYVHENKGPGLWTDINNIYTLYEGNRVFDNFGPGIDHEISYQAVIRNNVVEGNGFGWTGWVDGAGILVANSPNVEVYGNQVRHNNDGIAGIHSIRDQADANHGPWELKNLWVHDNVIVMTAGHTGIVRESSSDDPVWSPEWNNRFDYNTYTLGAGDNYYTWDPWIITTNQWRIFGQDAHSTWTIAPPPASKVRQLVDLIVWLLHWHEDVPWGVFAVGGGLTSDAAFPSDSSGSMTAIGLGSAHAAASSGGPGRPTSPSGPENGGTNDTLPDTSSGTPGGAHVE